jgi:hypothetical protein
VVKVYQPLHPTRNCGFYIVAASVILGLLTVGFIVLGAMSAPGMVWLIVGLVLMLISVGILFAIGWALRNEPRRVILGEDELMVETEDGKRELEIPYSKISAINEGKAFIVDVKDPQYEKYKLWYRGLVIDWQDGDTERRSYISERNTTEFDDLMDEAFARAPEPARGPRFYER